MWWTDASQRRLVVTHSHGFFSCCNVRLVAIITYWNTFHHLPHVIDSSQQFHFYRDSKSPTDLTTLYFAPFQVDPMTSEYGIESGLPEFFHFHWDFQFLPYKDLNWSILSPLMNTFFRPSQTILEQIHDFQIQYQVNTSHTLAIFYRGNDKCTETLQPSYECMLEQVDSILEQHSIITDLLVQTDENEFRDYVSHRYAGRNLRVYWFQEIPAISRNGSTSIQFCLSRNEITDKTVKYIASIVIMSTCASLCCTSGNGELFVNLYRGHSHGVSQFLNHTWHATPLVSM